MNSQEMLNSYGDKITNDIEVFYTIGQATVLAHIEAFYAEGLEIKDFSEWLYKQSESFTDEVYKYKEALKQEVRDVVKA